MRNPHFNKWQVFTVSLKMACTLDMYIIYIYIYKYIMYLLLFINLKVFITFYRL